MAKFIPGPLTGEIRNKLGAQVFSRNAFGAYTRGHAFPDQTITTPRALTQARWAAAVASWNADVTDNQRAAWETLARQLGSRPGPVNGRKLSGRTLFLSSYCNLDNIGVAPLTDTPDQALAGQLNALTATCNADTLSLELTADEGTDPPDQGLIIFASPPLNASRHTARDLWRQIAAIPPNPAFPLDLWAEFTAVHPLPQPSQVIIFGVSPVAALTGIAGPRLVARTVIQGTGAPMIQRTTVLTDAQIKALPTTPVTVVTAVAGKIIVPIFCTLQLNAAAAAYTNISAGAANYVNISMVTGKLARMQSDAFFTPAGKRTAHLPGKNLLDAVPPTTTATLTSADLDAALTAAALTLFCNNAAGAFTGGNAANQLTVTVWYQLINPI